LFSGSIMKACETVKAVSLELHARDLPYMLPFNISTPDSLKATGR